MSASQVLSSRHKLFFSASTVLTPAPIPSPTTDSKTFKKPRRPFEKERLDNELKTVGEFGLRNKRELWRVQFALNKLRNAARVLLTLDEKDPKRIFEGEAIMRRMYRYGLLVRLHSVILNPSVARLGRRGRRGPSVTNRDPGNALD